MDANPDSADRRPAKKPDPYRQILLATIAVLVFAAAAYYAYGVYTAANAPAPSGGGRSVCPGRVADGLICQTSAGGQYAWYAAEAPAAGGVAPPAGATVEQQKTAEGGEDCYTEGYCQVLCEQDPACTFYTYDSSEQGGPSGNCTSAGSVCTIYSGGGGAPPSLSAGLRYVTGGAPAPR